MILRRKDKDGTTVFRISDETGLGHLLKDAKSVTLLDLWDEKVTYEKLAETADEWELEDA